jgi:hypothetical protein
MLFAVVSNILESVFIFLFFLHLFVLCPSGKKGRMHFEENKKNIKTQTLTMV